ncbi:hypothetical protein KVU_2161 [Ketogulonicigenium vulgare WSH-001]|uniref:Glycosyltransferase 61 catalytic domain-containing protein n=1 Tax=Ketogulonicigenium vulgare (strain WSH-001) TaxID=759362 RepID=F9Y5S5_KETVW|nr:hypothetical protein KVU_2161 [Ketogulonicigenium vulgare WSH-001]
MQGFPMDNTEFDEIFDPTRDKGIHLFPGSTMPLPQKVERARVDYIIATEDPGQAGALRTAMLNKKDQALIDGDLLLPSVPLVVENFTYEARLPRVNGKLLLSGASGRRVRKRLLWGDRAGEQDRMTVAQLTEAISRPNAVIPTAQQPREMLEKLPFVIEMKNATNFYHFTSETLIYFSLYRKFALTGPIHIITADPKPPSAFVVESIRLFYPELLDRVSFRNKEIAYNRAIIPFNLQHYFSHLRDLASPPRETKFVSGDYPEPQYENMKAIAWGARDEALYLHRVGAVEIPSETPIRKRIYVGRKSGKSRNIVGEDELIARLETLGFKTLYFEDYTPLEQAQIMQGVDIMISGHGAGFTNMLYAKKGATLIEISHLQTARHRFGDFHMHAGVSGARHIHFFADHDFDTTDGLPNMHKDGHVGIYLSENALDRLEGLIMSLIQRGAFLKQKLAIDALEAAGDYAGIIATIEGDPRFLYAYSDVAVCAAQAYEKLGNPQQAARHCRIAQFVSPFRSKLFRNVVLSLIAAGDHVGAKAEMKRFRAFAPGISRNFESENATLLAALSDL